MDINSRLQLPQDVKRRASARTYSNETEEILGYVIVTYYFVFLWQAKP